MIRFRLKEVMADWEYRSAEKLTLEKLSAGTGIHRVTLSKIANIRGYSTTTSNIDKICNFLGCRVEKLMEHVQDSILPQGDKDRAEEEN